jgi:hypothetical protein
MTCTGGRAEQSRISAEKIGVHFDENLKKEN